MPHTDTPLAPDTRGRGLAATIYVLYLGSIMAVVTAPIGVLIAHVRRGRVPPMADSHLQFQIRTFWLGALGGLIALAAWNLLGWVGAPCWASWTLGYGLFPACRVGIQRLMSSRPVDNPRSLLFGGAAVRLDD